MKQSALQIGHIPALLWGEKTGRLLIAVHGSQSHKADTIIGLLAEHAIPKGYQVLSFDLPGHGDRKREATLCKAQICTEELRTVMAYAQTQAAEISLFGCSIGAYFGLLALHDVSMEQALFLSPVVDMERLIQNMMLWFSVSEERLQAEEAIATPIGETLYWDYYQYVKAHPIARWDTPTDILYGSADNLCEREVMESFARRFCGKLTILENGEHFFHSPAQLAFYESWLQKSLR